MSMSKKPKPECEHLDFDNERDCHKEAEYRCMCCGAFVCPNHKERECPYGGMGYNEL